jgi:hypothetical protein
MAFARPVDISSVLLSLIELDLLDDKLGSAIARGEEVLQLVEKCPAVASPIIYLRLAELALATGRLDRCGAHLSAIPFSALPARGQQDVLALKVLLDLATGREQDQDNWRRLLVLTERLLSQNGQVWPVLGLSLTAASAEQIAAATNLALRYAQSTRREPSRILLTTLELLARESNAIRARESRLAMFLDNSGQGTTAALPEPTDPVLDRSARRAGR